MTREGGGRCVCTVPKTCTNVGSVHFSHKLFCGHQRNGLTVAAVGRREWREDVKVVERTINLTKDLIAAIAGEANIRGHHVGGGGRRGGQGGK